MQTTVATYNPHFKGEVFLEEQNNTWNTPFLFNGKELDEETGLYYYGFIGGNASELVIERKQLMFYFEFELSAFFKCFFVLDGANLSANS